MIAVKWEVLRALYDATIAHRCGELAFDNCVLHTWNSKSPIFRAVRCVDSPLHYWRLEDAAYDAGHGASYLDYIEHIRLERRSILDKSIASYAAKRMQDAYDAMNPRSEYIKVKVRLTQQTKTALLAFLQERIELIEQFTKINVKPRHIDHMRRAFRAATALQALIMEEQPADEMEDAV